MASSDSHGESLLQHLLFVLIILLLYMLKKRHLSLLLQLFLL